MASDTQDFDNAVTIVGSTVNVPITIAGTSVTLSVSITAASVTLNMNFSGQTTAVFSGSQYAIQLGNGVYVNGNFAVNAAPGLIIAYSVPAGKTFYCQGWAFGVGANVAIQSCVAQLIDTATIVLSAATAQGAITPLDTPVPFATGHSVLLKIGQSNAGAVNQTCWASFWGWLG